MRATSSAAKWADKNKRWAIYMLVSPGAVYIGITTQPLHQRLRQHLASGAHQGEWIPWLAQARHTKIWPIIVPLWHCFSHREAQRMEQRFVTLLLECSIKVLNIKHLPLAQQSYVDFLASRHKDAAKVCWQLQGCIIIMLAGISGVIPTDMLSSKDRRMLGRVLLALLFVGCVVGALAERYDQPAKTDVTPALQTPGDDRQSALSY